MTLTFKHSNPESEPYLIERTKPKFRKKRKNSRKWSKSFKHQRIGVEALESESTNRRVGLEWRRRIVKRNTTREAMWKSASSEKWVPWNCSFSNSVTRNLKKTIKISNNEALRLRKKRGFRWSGMENTARYAFHWRVRRIPSSSGIGRWDEEKIS